MKAFFRYLSRAVLLTHTLAAVSTVTASAPAREPVGAGGMPPERPGLAASMPDMGSARFGVWHVRYPSQDVLELDYQIAE